jgi:DNA-binding NarL/FixJ family response regulator
VAIAEGCESESRVKILIVDDHPLILEALRHVLRALDSAIEVLEARETSEALTCARAHSDIDLVLLDLGLPGKTGLDALHELRSEQPDLPVVVLSATEDRETVIGAVDAGAMGFISKASRNDVLVNALRIVLSGAVYLPPQLLQHRGATAAESENTRPSSLTYRDVGLTDRQADVLSLLIQGKSNKLICRELGLAEGTVKIHVTAILKALNVVNRTQAVVAVGRLGLRLAAPAKAPLERS